MNERMLELLVQSGLLINVSEYRVNELDPNIKKFAELIVKEMVDECAKVCVQHTGWTPDMIAKQVKQHFGVEE